MWCNAPCRSLDGIKIKPVGRVDTGKPIRHHWDAPVNPQNQRPNSDCDAVVDIVHHGLPAVYFAGLFLPIYPPILGADHTG